MKKTSIESKSSNSDIYVTVLDQLGTQEHGTPPTDVQLPQALQDWLKDRTPLYWFDVQEAAATKDDGFYMCVEQIYENQKTANPAFKDVTEVDDWDDNRAWSKARREENRVRLERYNAGIPTIWNPEQMEDRPELPRSTFPGNPSQAATPKKIKKVKDIDF